MAENTNGRLGAPLHSLVTPRGGVEVWRPATGLLVTRVTGYLSLDGAQVIASTFRPQVAEDGWCMSFNDWGQMDDYDGEARTLLTRAVYDLLSHVKGGHFFVRSRVVAFGVQVANVVLRPFTLHPSEASLQRELSGALANRGRAPPGSNQRPSG
jgi:hypothetical protein